MSRNTKHQIHSSQFFFPGGFGRFGRFGRCRRACKICRFCRGGFGF